MVQKMMKHVLFIIVSHLVLIGYDVSATPYWPGALENFNAEVSAVAGTPFKELTGKYMKRHKLWWKNGKFCHSKKPDKSIFVANLSSATNYWHDDSTSVSCCRNEERRSCPHEFNNIGKFLLFTIVYRHQHRV